MAHSAQRSTMEATGPASPKSELQRERERERNRERKEGERERWRGVVSNFCCVFVFMAADLLAMTW